jgi:jasmonate O-methyltransferase
MHITIIVLFCILSFHCIQEQVISLTKVIREEAAISLYCNSFPRSLAIADLGCSSGPNTLLVLSEFIKVVEKLCRELNYESPEYMVFLNDLPGNDFNTIFRSLDRFKERLRGETKTKMGPCYISGVPGSFYGRIFPNQSLHFVHSSYSLQWLSKVKCLQLFFNHFSLILLLICMYE